MDDGRQASAGKVATSTSPSSGAHSEEEYDGEQQPHDGDGGVEVANEQGAGGGEAETAEAESTISEERGSRASAGAGSATGAPPVLHGHGGREMGMLQRVGGLWSSWMSWAPGPNPDSGWLAARASPPVVVVAVETEERDAEGDEGVEGAEEGTTGVEGDSASAGKRKKDNGGGGGLVHRIFGSGRGGRGRATAKPAVRVRCLRMWPHSTQDSDSDPLTLSGVKSGSSTASFGCGVFTTPAL